MGKALVGLMLSFAAAYPGVAKEYQVSVTLDSTVVQDTSDITPIKYVFNQQGELLYKRKGAAPRLASYLNDEKPASPGDMEIAKLTPFLPKEYDFSATDYTLILVRGDVDNYCLECKQHAIKMRRIHEKFRKQGVNVNFVQVILTSQNPYSSKTVTEEEWNHVMKPFGVW